MARSDKRYMVYPSPWAVEIVGSSAPALNQGIECWAALLARAMGDNARTFLESSEPSGIGPDPVEPQGLHEWGVLADTLKDRQFDPGFANPGQLVATAVEDAHRLENVAEGWYLHVGAETYWREPFENDVKALIEKLQTLDYVHAWALIKTIQWYWDHCETIDRNDRWWTLPFRKGRLKAQHQGSPGKAAKGTAKKELGNKRRPGRTR